MMKISIYFKLYNKWWPHDRLHCK